MSSRETSCCAEVRWYTLTPSDSEDRAFAGFGLCGVPGMLFGNFLATRLHVRQTVYLTPCQRGKTWSS